MNNFSLARLMVLCTITSFQVPGFSQGCVSAPYPDTDPIYIQVITADNYCCNVEWDAICQESYDALSNPAGGETCSTALPAAEGVNTADGPFSGFGCYNCLDAIHADWFVYPATSTGMLTVSSCNGGADTRLWVYESPGPNCTNLVPIAHNDDFCEISPGGDDFASGVTFPVCAGKYYFFEWDDHWDNNGFDFDLYLLEIPGADLAVTGTQICEYTSMPYSGGILDFDVSYKNIGSVAITGIQSDFKITRDGSNYSSANQSVINLLSTCTADTFHLNTQVHGFGAYEAKVTLTGAQTENDTYNNVLQQNFVIDTVFSRDNGLLLQNFSIGDTAIVGHSFFLNEPDLLTSVSFKLDPSVILGESITHIVIYAADATGMPVTLLTGPVPVTFSEVSSADWITKSFPGGINLGPGFFFVGLVEQVDSPLPLGYSDGVFTPGRAFLTIPGLTSGFESLDDFIAMTPMIRANFGATGVGLPELEPSGYFKIIPNPTSGEATIKADLTGEIVISVIDETGKIAMEKRVDHWNASQTIDLTSLTDGVYTIRLSAPGKTMTQQLLIRKE